MSMIFEILKGVLPVVISVMLSFLLTKYTYYGNIPLDKLEIAYKRIYYPIYRIISERGNDEDIDWIISESKLYFQKYDIYIDNSTKRAFRDLIKSTDSTQRKVLYINYKNNIYDRNSFLRRRLGYLESGILQMYKYLSPTAKASLRIVLELCLLYIMSILYVIFETLMNNLAKVFLFVSETIFFIIVVEIIIMIFKLIYYKIRKHLT